jgi:hypothetical protein
MALCCLLQRCIWHTRCIVPPAAAQRLHNGLTTAITRTHQCNITLYCTITGADAEADSSSSSRSALAGSSWDQTREQLSLTLLSHYLVPAFRAAPNSIDRISFSIQELLVVIYEAHTADTAAAAAAAATGDSSDTNDPALAAVAAVAAAGVAAAAASKGGSSSSSNSSRKPALTLVVGSSSGSGSSARQQQQQQQQQKRGPMPEWLADVLREHSVLDAAEPLWGTSYQIMDEPGRRPPFFNRGITNSSSSGSSSGAAAAAAAARRQTLQSWLGSWCRHLCIGSKGPLREAFLVSV